MDTSQTTAVKSRPGNIDPEERTEGTTADPSIKLTGVTGGMAGVVHGNFRNTLIVTIPDHLHNLLERTKEKIGRDTAGMVRVSAVDDVLEKMEDQRWITITGNAGDGKTVLGYLVLKEFLQKNVRVFSVSKPEEYEQIAKMKEDKVIMFDDRFGGFLADLQLIKKWFDVIQEILKDVEGENPKVKVIFISRKKVVNESTVSLGHLKVIFDKECVIDLSKRKLPDERLKILQYHLGHENMTFDQETKKRVCNMEVAHGFPFCCKMFSKFKSKGNDVPIEQYFKSPLQFLDLTTKVLYNETCTDLFKLMIKNDGELNVYNIKDEGKREALLKVEREQEGSYYTVWRHGICQFAHPAVYESVLNVISDIDPLYCVQHAALSVIQQKMIISTSDEEDCNRARCYIIVKPISAVLKALAERFREEILNGDYSVFKHRLCQSKEFCKALVSCCVHTNDEKAYGRHRINIPGWDGRTMLWTALLGGIMSAFCVLVQAGADIEIADESGCTPLLYLSKQDELDGDSIRMVIRNRADLNVKDEKGATPLLYLLERDEVDYALIREVITTGKADCNIQDERKTSPLRCLCFKKSVDIDTLMLMVTKSRADIMQTDEEGDTPLHWLSKNNNVPVEGIKRVVVELRGNINVHNRNGSTPLHFLCDRKVDIKSLVSLIQEAKGDINMKDEFENTPLHYLCYSNNQTASYLLEKIPEADPNKQNVYGYTANDYLLRKVPSVLSAAPIINNLTMVTRNENYTAHGSQIGQFGSGGIATGTTFFGDTTTGGRVPRPNHLEILARTKNEIELKTAGMIRVAAVDEVINKLNNGQHWVTITGNAGEGKTTLGYLVLKELQREEVYTLYRPEEYDQIENIDEERVIMLDDRFGTFQADPQKIDKWFDVLDRILSKTDTRKTKVIFISRTNVLQKSKNFLGHLTDDIFDRVCAVDISKRELTENVKNERMKILNYHLRHEKEKTKDAIKKRVCNKEVAHGFPRCCKMFEKVMSNRNNIPIVDFFRSPLKFLDMTTKVLYDGNCQKLFKMMIKNDGQFDINTIENEDTREELHKIIKEQEGSYIRVTSNGICQFAHQSVYESVLNVINDIDPLWCVQYANLSVVRQNMIIATSDEEDNSRSSSYIIVKQIPVVLNALAERFREEMLKGDYSVFGLRLCQSKLFCEALVTCVCFDEEKSKQFIKTEKQDRKNMLWTALSSGNMIAVCVIMDKGANTVDVNVRDDSQRTPLHYLLEHPTIHKEALKIMIRDLKSYVNVRDISGCTLLHYLSRRMDINVHVDLLKLMLSDLNQCEQNKSTPLHYLCAHPGLQPDTLRLLVQDGKGDLNSSDEHGTTPFHYICENTRVDSNVKLRITNTGKGDLNKQDDNGITPLHVLCKGSLPMKDVLTLIKEGDKADMYGNTPLHFLCRRRGISDEEIQQLKQLPESIMKKQNKLECTPLDYLDQNGSLRWTDGVIARSAADLVLCRVKHGDASAIVLGPAMTLSPEKVHEWLQVEDFQRELTNMFESGLRNTQSQFLMFQGTCSLPLSPSPLCTPSYWETLYKLRWTKRGWTLILEMGVVEGKNLDMGNCVSAFPNSFCVSVEDACAKHTNNLCIQVRKRDMGAKLHQVCDCVSLSIPTSGAEVTLTFGLVLDVGRGRLGFIDVVREELLCKIAHTFTEEVVPMFYLHRFDGSCATRMRLVSGRQIFICDRKIQLIQQALSD